MTNKLLHKFRSYRRGLRNRQLLASLTTEEAHLIKSIKQDRLTYLSVPKLVNIVQNCRRIESDDIPGVIVEAGCALGGSAIVLGKMKSPSRPFQMYDVFGMIPPPTQEDPKEVHDRYAVISQGKSGGLGGDLYYGYETDLLNKVITNMESYGLQNKTQSITLVQGLVQDTLRIDQPVALAHVDVDWYDPVMTCLERIGPHLTPGGSIILDDYHNWGGCRKATDEYFDNIKDQFNMDDALGSMTCTRI